MSWLKGYVNDSNSGCDNTGPILSLYYEEKDFLIYPNPITNISSLKINSDQEIKSVQIKDLRGITINGLSLNKKNPSIEINLDRGLYIVEIVVENNSKVFKKLIVR